MAATAVVPVREASERVRFRSSVLWLVALVAVIGTVAAVAGLWSLTAGSRRVTSMHGETVGLFGVGLYRDDSLFVATAHQGADVVTLLLGLPLLVVSAVGYRRGSIRGALLLGGALAWFLYSYASTALQAAFNPLFLAYVTLMSASLFAIVLTLLSVDRGSLQAALPNLPRKGPGILLVTSGVLTAVIWLVPLLSSTLTGQQPKLLDTYTTMVTDALDLGFITPTLILAGVLVLRREAVGYLLAVPLLVLETLLAPMITAQTILQLRAGISFEPGEIVGPISGFFTLAVIAVAMLVTVLRGLGPVDRAA